MKHLIYILSYLFLLLAATACSDDEPMGDPCLPKEGILLRLSNGSLENNQTKTLLESTANLHHIREVYACLYRMDDGGTDGTLVMAPQKLDWSPMDSASYGVDRVQMERFVLSHTETLGAGSYTLLCVGLDNDPDRPDEPNAKTTYNLPDALKKDSKLSEAKACLATGKTKEDIARSELFAGWKRFDYAPGRLSEVDVEMRRRVAGVICYLTDIPEKVSKETRTYRTTTIRLRLFADQNSVVSCLRPRTTATDKLPDDYGETPLTSSDLLWEQSVEDCPTQPDRTELLAITPADPKKQLPNTLLGGAYLLPIRHEGDQKNTLQVEIWGKPIDESNPHDWKQGTEELLSTFPAVYDEAADAGQRNHYPIRANYVYHIGQKPDNNHTLNDQPESLAGTKLNLRVKAWTNEEINVQYPSVPIYATMEFEKGYGANYIFDSMGSRWLRVMNEADGSFTERLYHDTLLVQPSLLRLPWKLAVREPGVYIKTKAGDEPADNVYAKEYAASGDELKKETRIELLITDYINKEVNYNDPSYDLSKDYREVHLALETYKSRDAATGELRDLLNTETFVVKQYNAIFVDVKEGGDTHKRAFARFDVETYRDASGYIRTDVTDAPYVPKDHPDVRNGERPVTPESNDGSGLRMGYGYWDTNALYIVDAYTKAEDVDGQLCYTEAIKLSEKGDEKKRRWKFCRSAINRAARKRVSIKDDETVTAKEFTLEKLNDSQYWYLPASYELIAFLGLYGTTLQFGEAMNLKLYDGKDKRYWSAQPKHGGLIGHDFETAWCSYVKPDGHVWGWREYTDEGQKDDYEEVSRLNTFYLRQACHVPN